MAPFSSYLQPLDVMLLPSDLRPQYTSQVGSTLVTPVDPSLEDTRIILSNFYLPLSNSNEVVQSGDIIDGSVDISPVGTSSYVHVEAFKVLDGVWFRIDPTPFIPPVADPQVEVEFECNDVIVYMGGLVIERRNLLSSGDVTLEMVGEPLVQGKTWLMSFYFSYKYTHQVRNSFFV